MISVYPPVTIHGTAWTVLPIEIQILDERLRDLEMMPEYKTSGASGMDLRIMSFHLEDGPARLLSDDVILWPGKAVTFGSGVAIAIPPGYEGQIRPRSSMSRKNIGICGTIDSDYRGEIGLILINLGQDAVRVESLSRVAQLVIAPVVRAELQVVDALPPTARGSGGYGSTGVR